MYMYVCIYVVLTIFQVNARAVHIPNACSHFKHMYVYIYTHTYIDICVVKTY